MKSVCYLLDTQLGMRFHRFLESVSIKIYWPPTSNAIRQDKITIGTFATPALALTNLQYASINIKVFLL